MARKLAFVIGGVGLAALFALVGYRLLVAPSPGLQSLSGPVGIARMAQARHGFLGVKLDAPVSGTVVIETVFPASGAEEAGLQAGDIVAAVEGEPVSSVSDVQELVADKKPGAIVRLRVQRDGDEALYDVRLMSAAEMSASRELADAELATLPDPEP